MSVTLTVGMLAKFGEFYWSQGGIRTRASFCNLAVGDWRTALAEFLESYAFERQGRSPHYPKAAAEAVREYKGNIPEADALHLFLADQRDAYMARVKLLDEVLRNSR